jgi:anaerobic magnesium-protoporphyrin IX monomethyl ester cyclase
MRVLLVEPPYYSFMNYDKWYYPVSLTQLAAVAHAAKHEVKVYDGDKYFPVDPSTKDRSVYSKKQNMYSDNVDNLDYSIWKHFKRVLEDYNPEVVGISTYTFKLRSAINILKIVREFNPAIKICVGGAHATAVPESLISNEYIDTVFIGHADMSFPEWLANSCPKGIIAGDSSKLDLDNTPYVRRQALLFPERYSSYDLCLVMASRGCLGRCTFCSELFMWSGRPKYRTTASMSSELTELAEDWNLKNEPILLGTPSFGEIPAESKRIAKVMKDFDLSWATSLRWSNITKELLDYYLSCGCYEINIGLESGTDKILKYMKKSCNRKMIKEKTQLLKSVGVRWRICTIVGFPIETIEDMEETVRFAEELSPSYFSLNSLSPLPGTQVYKDIPGMTVELASSVSQLNPNYCFSTHMDLETYRDLFHKLSERVDKYNNANK